MNEETDGEDEELLEEDILHVIPLNDTTSEVRDMTCDDVSNAEGTLH